jgi:hypothetical protein
MPPNPRAERRRHFNLPPLRRSPRRVVAFVSLHKNRPNYGSNADRPHNRNEPPCGNRGPRPHAERTRRTFNQREANNRVRHQNLVRLVPPTAPQNSRVDRTHRVFLNTSTRISLLNSAPQLVLSEHGLPMANTSTPPPAALSGAPTTPPQCATNIATVNVVGLNRKKHALENFIATDLIKIVAITEIHHAPSIKIIVIYTTREEGKAFVHANCMFGHDAQRSGRCNSKWMTKNSVFLMTSWKRQVPRSTKWCLRNQNYDTRKNWKYLHNGRPRSREKTKAASARLFNVEEYTVCISKRLYLQVSR